MSGRSLRIASAESLRPEARRAHPTLNGEEPLKRRAYRLGWMLLGRDHAWRTPRVATRWPDGLAEHSSYARILYMTTLSLADARANLSKLVESAVATHERFEVTRNGDRAVVLLSAEDYDALLETVDVLSCAEEVQALKEGLDDLDAGRTSSLDEVRSAMLRRGRLQS